MAHVFHAALSRGQVPRWFTEGLAELDVGTLWPWWARPEGIGAGEAGPVASVADLEQTLGDGTVRDDAVLGRAYAHAFEIVSYVHERHGHAAIVAMLRSWGRGHPTARVVREVLGIPVAGLEAAVRAIVEARVRARQPSEVSARLRLAENARARGDRAAALRALDAAAALDAHRVDVWTQMLKVARDVPDDARVGRALERIAELDPYARDVLASLVPRLLHAKRWDDAFLRARALVYLDPARPDAHHWLGHALLEQRKFDAALEEFDRALALGIAHPEQTRVLRARALAGGGN
jgi:tetratricopeptide (TPR) repeat protein